MKNIIEKLFEKSEKEEKNKYIISMIVISFLVIFITGATYAYFALTASNNAITAAVGATNLSLTVNKVLPTTTPSNMVPQLEDALPNAVSSEYNCIDDNDNVICQVYKVTIKNTANVNAILTGTIEFSGIDDLPHLKWRRIDSIESFGDYSTMKAKDFKQNIEEDVDFTPNESKEYYIVVWVDEIDGQQTDNGTFRATINYEQSEGLGITSTIGPTLLKDVEPGSYVAYTGSNGCTDAECTGQNVNYVDDTDMGYCSDSNYKYSSNGWRVAYTKDNTAHLISGGSPVCSELVYGDNKITTTYLSTDITTRKQYYFSTDVPNIVLSSSSSYNFSFSSTTGYYYPDDIDSISKGMFMKTGSSSTTKQFYYLLSKNSSSKNIKTSKLTLSYVTTDTSSGLSRTTTYWGTSISLSINTDGTGKIKLSNPVTRTIGNSTYKYGCVGTDTTCTQLYAYINGRYILYKITTATSVRDTLNLNSGYGTYCDSYTFDKATGNFTLGSSCITADFSSRYSSIISTYKYTCGVSANTCTTLDEIMSSSSPTSKSWYEHENYANASDFSPYLNEQSLKYCNPTYAYNGTCNSSSAWAMNDNDFKEITKSKINSCYQNTSKKCGSDNDLINNGGYYWNNAAYDTSSIFYSSPSSSYYSKNSSNLNYGIRPVIRMSPNVIVTGGTGTYTDPYQIAPYSTVVEG